MMTSNQRALKDAATDESRRFRVALPSLVQEYNGKWVIFKDGVVRGVFEDEDSALGGAVLKYGPRGGFIVALVAADSCEPVSLSAAIFSAPQQG